MGSLKWSEDGHEFVQIAKSVPHQLEVIVQHPLVKVRIPSAVINNRTRLKSHADFIGHLMWFYFLIDSGHLRLRDDIPSTKERRFLTILVSLNVDSAIHLCSLLSCQDVHDGKDVIHMGLVEIFERRSLCPLYIF